MKTFHLTIADIKGKIFEGEAASISLTGGMGEMTILPFHAPIITVIKTGILTIRIGGETKKIKVSSGLLEFSNNTATAIVY